MNISEYINLHKIKKENYKNSKPFDHLVIDNFLNSDFAKLVEDEFFLYESDKWHVYSNQIEEKKTCNTWNNFESNTYKLFQLLNSKEMVEKLSELVDESLFADIGLHGGGLHIHGKGGNLNPHLDYSIHPKLGLQRKLNIIIYVSSDRGLCESGEGALGMWEGNANSPEKLVKQVNPVFNRAVIFDTTQNSWHGLVNPLSSSADYYRKSIAAYYLRVKPQNADPRSRALFAPREGQFKDQNVIELIEKRASEKSYSTVYKNR